MRSIVIASSSRSMATKLNRILPNYMTDIYYSKNEAELYTLCDRLGGGVLIVAALREANINDIKNTLSSAWDIIAVLPAGAPEPFYSSNLTAFTAPVNIGEFLSTLEALMSVSDYKKTAYETEKADAVSRAKNILIDKNEISEDEAHYLLQRMSMDMGVSIKKVAQTVIKEYK